MHCLSCGFENPEWTKFCGGCGSSLTNRCPSCGRENPLQFKFCGACGTSLRTRGGCASDKEQAPRWEARKEEDASSGSSCGRSIPRCGPRSRAASTHRHVL